MTTHRTADGRVLVDVTVLVHALIAACAVGLVALALGLMHHGTAPAPLPSPASTVADPTVVTLTA